jgi:ABC-type sugar transport system substrate-binding protein/AraC-like DNA-binding protein
MKSLFLTLLIAYFSFLISSCQQEDKHYVIGVSQCSADIWREKQNAELRMGAYLQNNVELRFAAAYDSDERQIEQIDSLVATGIDLLIVAPNQVQTISPAIDRAYDKGIPVIVFERKTNSQKYTAFISADNYEMGRVMGEYIASQLHGKGRVMEIMGLKGSSPAIERHNGFTDALRQYPDINVVATLQGDWTEESAFKATEQWLSQQPKEVSQQPIDFVFGQNDRMAIGARKAIPTPDPSRTGGELYQSSDISHQTKFCGIDGLPGENGGIRLVRDSILDASYIYPTHGDKIIQLAVEILEGKPYKKETRLMSALVTRDNARVLLMQDEEMMRQAEYLDQLHNRADNYLQQLGTQRVVSWMAVGVIVLLLITMVLFYLYFLKKTAIQHEHVVNTLWNLKPEDIPQATPQASENHEEPTNDEPVAASFFITRFKEAVEARLTESELSVEDLAADMNLSRVQLYRKVKSFTGSTPVELVRTARLNRGYQLLLTTDKSVSEVAYQVGFSAPSYFTKCFKEEYGMLPGDVRK